MSVLTALMVITIFVIYRGFSPEEPYEIRKIPGEKSFTLLSFKEVKNPVTIESENIDNTFEQVRKLIQAYNGKMQKAIWIGKGIKLIFYS